MRRSKEIWYLLLFSLLIAAVAGLIMTVGRKEEKNSYTVSVIVNNSSDSRWTSLREGAEAAARDYNIRLNYVLGKAKRTGDHIQRTGIGCGWHDHSDVCK